VRWAVRTDGNAGFLFVNNYQRLQPMPAKDAVQFQIRLAHGALLIPARPITLPADQSFFFPFNLNLGAANLTYATAQPICQLKQGTTTYTFFEKIPGITAEFRFDTPQPAMQAAVHPATAGTDERIFTTDHTGTEPVYRLSGLDDASCAIILLDEPTALNCWKIQLDGHEVLCLTKAGLTVDGNNMTLTSPNLADLTVSIFPPPPSLTINGESVAGEPDGIFRRFTAAKLPAQAAPIAIPYVVTAPGPARQIKTGHGKVAEAPTDADFDNAAVWRIKLPSNITPDRDLLLRIHYIGDVARLYLDGKLIDDNFYNGDPFDLGLRRFGPYIYNKELLLKILPLRKDAPIYLPPDAWPKFEDSSSGVALNAIDVIENHSAQFASSDAKSVP
jgi:hypothetical protein